MRYSAAFAALLATANGLSIFGGSQDVIINDDLKIPGDSPLELCQGDHQDDLVQIEKVDLEPNPPSPGKELIIKATGTVKEDIEEGAYIELQVKYGLIRLIKTRADLCEQVQNVDMECPINKGKLEITKTVELPREIPPGKYTVFADVYTKEDLQITCLTATVNFARSGAVTLEL